MTLPPSRSPTSRALVYLHQTETFRFLGTQLTYQAAYRKLPLSVLGIGFCLSAWALTQSRRDYRRHDYQEMPPPSETQSPLGTVTTEPLPVTPTDRPTGAVSQSGAIAERDLTAEIAQYDGHILITSRTRSGKTTSVQSAIRQTHSHYKGRADFWVFDLKGAVWCGLERTHNYLFCNEPYYILQVLQRLESLIKVMQQRQQTRMAQGYHYRSGSEP